MRLGHGLCHAVRRCLFGPPAVPGYGPELFNTPWASMTLSAGTITASSSGLTWAAAAAGDNARCTVAGLKDDTTYKVEVDTTLVTASGLIPHLYGPTSAHHGSGTAITTSTTSVQEITTTGTSSILSQIRLTAQAGFSGKITRVSIREKLPAPPVDPGTPPGFTALAVDNTGATDVTAAINSAIATAGNYFLPAGTYLIDGSVSIKPKSNSKFQMHANAVLQVKTNGLDSYSGIYVNLVDNVEVFGGTIIGDRDTHTGTTGEGGHCIRVHGSTNCKVHDITLKKGWGDGLYIGPNRDNAMVYSEDIEAYNVICDNNRRNGCSITNANRVLFRDSTCMNTIGTSPQCGIDVEPNADVVNAGTCNDVEIRNVTCTDNQSYGINVQRRVHNLNVNGCNLSSNNSCGMVVVESFNMLITGNTVRDNGSTGVFLKADAQVDNLSGNTFGGNAGQADRTPDITQSGIVAGTAKDLLQNGTAVVGSNTYL